jgi:hypothetical protein
MNRIIVFVPNKADSVVGHTWVAFYSTQVVLHRIRTNVYLHTKTKTHTYLRYTFQWI